MKGFQDTFIPVQHVILVTRMEKIDIEVMFQRTFYIIILISLCNLVIIQAQTGIQQGEVSYITSQNIYVKFDNTEFIQKGDTLLSPQDEILTPCLIVINKSTTSCVCKLVQECEIKKGQKVVFSPKIEAKVQIEEGEEIIKDEEEENQFNDALTDQEEKKAFSRYTEKIRGRVSASSYSNFTSAYSDRHRAMMRVSFRGQHLRNSPVSLEVYANYRQSITAPKEGILSNEGMFRIYTAALTYDVDSSMSLTLGRKINRRASSLGAIDGLQAEKHFGAFYTGAIVGFRPSFRDYGLNTKLFEYGAYTGFEMRKPHLFSSTTLGLLEQRNSGAIDRRYLYFQHHSNIGRSLYLFGSAEVDLFMLKDGQPSFTPRLTNIYTSVRYRFSRMIDLTLSYDARRNIIYYETLKTEIERLLDDEARQGARVRVNFRPFRYFNSGISYSKRFQSDQQNKSDNINGYLSHSKLPGIDGRMSVHVNWNQSSYLESRIISIRYARPIISRKLDMDVYFRMVNYQYTASEIQFNQQYYGASLDYNIGRSWMINVLYELSLREEQKTHRLNTRIIWRF